MTYQNKEMNSFEQKLYNRLVHIARESQQNIEISGYTSFFIGIAFGITAVQVCSSMIKR